MPYRRKFSSRRRGRGRRRSTPWYNRKYNAMQLAAKAARGVWYLKGLVNSELFKYDKPLGPSSIQDTGNIFALQGMAQGDGPSGRTGNSVLVRKLMVRLRFTKASTPSNTYIRAMIIQDNQQISDTDLSVSDLLQAVDVDSPLNLATVGRFKILMNKTIALTNDRSTTHIEKYFNMRHHIRYNGTTATDIQKGGLYLVLLGDQTVSTNYPALDGYVRLSYHDN